MIDKRQCLCCGQLHYLPPTSPLPIKELEKQLAILEGCGYTRTALLGKHRAQVEYQLPGMIEWLTAQ